MFSRKILERYSLDIPSSSAISITLIFFVIRDFTIASTLFTTGWNSFCSLSLEYLKSVVSEGDELSPKFGSEFSCGVNEFYKKISEFNKDANINNEMFSDIIRSEAGGIISMKVYGVKIKGSEFRNIFNLRSTNIQLEKEDDNIIMKVCGNGHGVGMSQYGAEYMGKNGADYKEILKKYYPGTEITNTY